MNQRIVLIHATPLAIAPINEAFRTQWPEAQISNLLDDSLSVDRAKDSELSQKLNSRINALADYAVSIEATAVLFTCSAFGCAIESSAARHPLPILKPNEAMFEAALEAGGNIVMLATFAPSVAGMEQEFYEMAASYSSSSTLTSYVVPGAREALNAGNVNEHNRRIVAAALQYQNADAIILAHFSMEIAYSQVNAAVRCKVLSSPQTAVEKIKRILTGKHSAD